jgi:hypothetical protein
MKDVHSLGSNLAYLKQLATASMDGIGDARREIEAGVFKGPLPSVVWAPAAVGGVIGVLSARMTRRHCPPSKTALDGLAGTLLGFAAGLACACAPLLRPVARTSARRINAIRDARWLETHPIDYA